MAERTSPETLALVRALLLENKGSIVATQDSLKKRGITLSATPISRELAVLVAQKKIKRARIVRAGKSKGGRPAGAMDKGPRAAFETKRRQQVRELLASGIKQPEEIGQLLGITARAVEYHLENIQNTDAEPDSPSPKK